MIVLAAALCIPLDIANEHIPWRCPIWAQAIIGGTVITAAELLAGCVLNLWLGLGVWNYSSLPGNLWGQICPQFWLLWCLLAGPVIVVFDWLCYALDGGERPHYVHTPEGKFNYEDNVNLMYALNTPRGATHTFEVMSGGVLLNWQKGHNYNGTASDITQVLNTTCTAITGWEMKFKDAGIVFKTGLTVDIWGVRA